MITNSNLHYTLIRKIIDHGHAPSNPELARHFETTEEEVVAALHRLQENHGVVLHPNEAKVWVIHPFSLAPTNFFVRSKKGAWWGNCAWCSLGVAALLETEVTISTSIGAEGKPIDIHITDGMVKEENLYIHFPIPMKNAWDNVIFTCSTMLVFEHKEQVVDWCTRHQIPLGDIQPIQRIFDFSKKWYGNHLNPNWVKWTVEEAKALFQEFGLTHTTWDLESSGRRF